jgi:mRNA interferase MazF
MGVVKRFEVYLVQLNPTRGSEIRKRRPCVVISPNETHVLDTVIVAPMTTKGKAYPTRLLVHFGGKAGRIVLDQIRTVDKTRLVRRLGEIDRRAGLQILAALQEMFAE